MKLHRIGGHEGIVTYAFFCTGCEDLHTINSSWQITGLEEDSPTVKPSVLVNKGRKNPDAHICHSFITEGSIRYLQDCTHHLVGVTLELMDASQYWD